MYSQLQLRAGSPDGRESCCNFQEGRALWGQCRIVWSGTWRFFKPKKKEHRCRGHQGESEGRDLKGREFGILPRNRFVILDYLTFRLEWRDDHGSLCISTIGLDTVLRDTVLWSVGYFDVLFIHGSVQKPIRIGGRN